MGKTILIVDDEYDIMNSLEMVFSSEGYAVRTAYNGKEALGQLKAEPRPDIILSDVMMPVMDGYALVKALRTVPEYRSVPIILVSAAQLDPSRVKKEDYALFIRKPFDLDRLIAGVDKVLTDKRTK